MNSKNNKKTIEELEDEYDVALADAALRKYKKNPKTYTLEEIKKDILG